MRKAADQGFSVMPLELVEFGCVDQARDDFAHVIGFLGVGRNDAADFHRIVKRVA